MMSAAALFSALLVASALVGCAVNPKSTSSDQNGSEPAGDASLPPRQEAPVGQDLIGKTREGGVVVYVFQPSDDGYDPKTPHGVIAAPEDVNTTYTDQWNGRQFTGEYVWSTDVYSGEGPDWAWWAIGDTSEAIGRGALNTDSILRQYPADTYPNSAAAVARAYRGGGYSDWFLPSMDELRMMYRSKQYLSGLQDGAYWTSTEVYDEQQQSGARVMYFKDEFPIDVDADYEGTKNGTERVRAARYF